MQRFESRDDMQSAPEQGKSGDETGAAVEEAPKPFVWGGYAADEDDVGKPSLVGQRFLFSSSSSSSSSSSFGLV